MLDLIAHLVAYAERNCPAYHHDSNIYAALAVAIWTPWLVQVAFIGLAYFRREALFWLVGIWSTLNSLLSYGIILAFAYDERPAGSCGSSGPTFPSAHAQYMGLVSGVALAYWYGWACMPSATNAAVIFLANSAFSIARIQLRYDSALSLAAGYALGLAEAMFWMSLLWRYRRRVEWLRTTWLGKKLGLYDTLCIAHGEVVAVVGTDPYAAPPAGAVTPMGEYRF